MLSPASLFSVPICYGPSVALAAAHLRKVSVCVAASLAGLWWRGPLGRHRGGPQSQGGSWGAVVSGVERLARGLPFLSLGKPSDKPAMWSLLPKMWGMTAGWEPVNSSACGESGMHKASPCSDRGDLLSHSWHVYFSMWWQMLLKFLLLT